LTRAYTKYIDIIMLLRCEREISLFWILERV